MLNLAWCASESCVFVFVERVWRSLSPFLLLGKGVCGDIPSLQHNKLKNHKSEGAHCYKIVTADLHKPSTGYCSFHNRLFSFRSRWTLSPNLIFSKSFKFGIQLMDVSNQRHNWLSIFLLRTVPVQRQVRLLNTKKWNECIWSIYRFSFTCFCIKIWSDQYVP